MRSTHLLEVGSSSENFVYEILYGEDVVLAEVGLNNSVVGERNALLVDLSVTTLVDQFPN